MKILAKILIAAAVAGGAGAVIYAAPGDGELTGSTDANVTEMITRVQSMNVEVQQDLRFVLHLQQTARKQKDVIKLNCVNDKLVQIKPLANLVERAQGEIVAAGKMGASGVYAQVQETVENVRRLRDQAQACVGEPTLETESTNSWTHPNVPDDPFTNPFGQYVEPPAYATPFY